MTEALNYPIRPPLAKIWWLAIRPKTLSLSWVPVLVGSSLSWQAQGRLIWPAVIVAAISAMLIQIGTNLHNDAKDFERGVDNQDRKGPLRVTAMGWLTASQVRKAAYMAFGSALIIGLYLIWLGGVPILILGLLSIGAGLAYTGGPRPIAYGSTGEIFVFLFFGLGAVTGVYYLNTGNISPSALAAGAALGLLAAAVLTVNNYRDMESDRAVGKTTLAIHLGQQATRVEYAMLMLTPFILVTPYNLADVAALLPWLILPLALWLVAKLFYTQPSPACNDLLALTAKTQLLFGLLLSASYLLIGITH